MAPESQLNSMEKRLSSVENRLTLVESRLTLVENRLDSMEKRLDSIEAKLDEVLRFQAAMVERWAHVDKRLSAHNLTLCGNGQSGLVKEVEQLKTAYKIGGRGFWVFVSMVSAVVSGTILILGGWASSIFGS